MAKKPSIWIDLDNSPHVPVFLPLIKHYRSFGVDVVLTARDHSQTLELLEIAGLYQDVRVVGRHHGKIRIKKLFGTFVRAMQLIYELCTSSPTVAVSHGSRSMVFAAWLRRIPILTMYDYEHTETFLFNKLSTRVLVPQAIPDGVLDEIGLSMSKRVKYPGIKEEIYLKDINRETEALDTFNNRQGSDISDSQILVVLRPPASNANYHGDRADEVFGAVLQYLLRHPNTSTIISPRNNDQREDIRRMLAAADADETRVMLLERAVDGIELLSIADLLISGGGTMNREAVLLGIPVYSIFAGKQGALDRSMEERGQITFIRDVVEVELISLQKRSNQNIPESSNRVERFIIGEIDKFLKQ